MTDQSKDNSPANPLPDPPGRSGAEPQEPAPPNFSLPEHSSPSYSGPGQPPPDVASGAPSPTPGPGFAPPEQGSGYPPPEQGPSYAPPEQGPSYAPPEQGHGYQPPEQGYPAGGWADAPPSGGWAAGPPLGPPTGPPPGPPLGAPAGPPHGQPWAPGAPTPPPPRRGLPATAIVAVAVAVVLLLALAGVGLWAFLDQGAPSAGDGNAVLKDYRDQKDLLAKDHKTGDIDYQVNPPVGGPHNPVWQNCQGDVYDEPIADEHAVHSLEHGAVWITYQPDLAQSEIDKLAERVRDTDYLMISPHKALDRPISLQAWGLQLKTDSADDPAIDEFIEKHRKTAGPEQGAPCSGGATETGETPQDSD